jgi:hypothetical protein
MAVPDKATGRPPRRRETCYRRLLVMSLMPLSATSRQDWLATIGVCVGTLAFLLPFAFGWLDLDPRRNLPLAWLGGSCAVALGVVAWVRSELRTTSLASLALGALALTHAALWQFAILSMGS